MIARLGRMKFARWLCDTPSFQNASKHRISELMGMAGKDASRAMSKSDARAIGAKADEMVPKIPNVTWCGMPIEENVRKSCRCWQQ